MQCDNDEEWEDLLNSIGQAIFILVTKHSSVILQNTMQCTLKQQQQQFNAAIREMNTGQKGQSYFSSIAIYSPGSKVPLFQRAQGLLLPFEQNHIFFNTSIVGI